MPLHVEDDLETTILHYRFCGHGDLYMWIMKVKKVKVMMMLSSMSLN